MRDYAWVALRCLAWPPIAVALSLQSVFRYGRGIAAPNRTGRAHQFMVQIYLAVFCRVMPKYYYIFDLHRPDFRCRAGEYLTRLETKAGIYRVLKPRENPQQLVRIKDKLVFSTFFAANGLPAVPLLAAFRDGTRLPEVGPRELARDCDLFVKPIQGRGGGGAESWQLRVPGCYRNSRGRELSLEQLLEHVALLSKGRGYLVQPRLLNHSTIADLSPGALSTVRLLTVLDERMEPEPVNAAFRMAVNKASPVDNFHAGGIAAAVDVDTGTLARASSLGRDGDFSWHESHPVTGGRILGQRLPDWEKAKSLVIAAHRLIAPRIVVGWDVGLLADGPCLIEGNCGPDLDIHQRAELRPIGNARLGELLAFHMERRLKL